MRYLLLLPIVALSLSACSKSDSSCNANTTVQIKVDVTESLPNRMDSDEKVTYREHEADIIWGNYSVVATNDAGDEERNSSSSVSDLNKIKKTMPNSVNTLDLRNMVYTEDQLVFKILSTYKNADGTVSIFVDSGAVNAQLQKAFNSATDATGVKVCSVDSKTELRYDDSSKSLRTIQEQVYQVQAEL